MTGHGYPPGWVLSGYKSKGKQQINAAIADNEGDLGITPEQLHKIISILQTGPPSGFLIQVL